MTKLREARNQAGPRMFSREELLMILAALEGKPVTINRVDLFGQVAGIRHSWAIAE